MSSLLKNLLFALGLALILWLGYTLFVQNDGTTDPNSAVNTQASLETQEFLIRLQSLRSINIDRSIFSDERFSTLVDFSVELGDEPVGRRNPFAPVE